ncbi:urotensin-2B [Elephas maximus indicus]|uniref:urotensin-2B n=1 Tax=Elephas maximus indicus TaxID=99487 RepID=UPI002116BDE7|nr:urotensin-2B [Elephas maximus indicus]
MKRILSIPLCFGVLSLLSVMILVALVDGRPYLTQENELFPDKDDTNHEDLLLALPNRNFDIQRYSNMDIELARKLEELNQLEKLKQQLMEAKAAEMFYAIDGLSSSHRNK